MNFGKILLNPIVFGLLLTTIFVFVSCDPDDEVETIQVKDYNADVIVAWNKVFLEVERYASGYRPGPANSALAYMGLASYEACITAMPEYNSLESVYKAQDLNIPNVIEGQTYHWPTVVNTIYGSMMKKFFPHVKDALKAKITTLQAEFDARFLQQEKVERDLFDRSQDYGKQVADAVFAWAASDPFGYTTYRNARPADYTPPTGVGKWQPSFPDYAKAVSPYWGKARTFAITESEKLTKPHLAFSEDKNSEFYKYAYEVYSKNNAVSKLTYEDRWIAEFWSDDVLDLTFSPGPRWIAIANQVLEAKKASLELALYTEASVSMALNDASVAGWHSKYVYNLERPVSYIRRVIDPNWTPHLGGTPSFPAYPSGHSIMGGAGAEMLCIIFGETYAMADRVHEGRTDFIGIPRSYASFRAMADENAYSRVPLGVHFIFDCTEGVKHGYTIGKKIAQLPWKK